MEFDRAAILDAFDRLGRLAWAAGKTVEIAVYGGSALMLSFDWRKATKDVDGVYEADRAVVRELAARIAQERNWPMDWLNDGVKGFLSERDGEAAVKRLSGEFPSAREPGLRIFVPTTEYMFAMKCRAMRLGGVEGGGDVNDIRRLAYELGLTSSAAALTLIETFYPGSQLLPRVRFGVEEIFDELARTGAHPGKPA